MAPVLGLFPLRYLRPYRATSTACSSLFVLFLLARRIVQFAVRPVAARRQGQSAARRPPSASRSTDGWSRIYTVAAGYAGIAGALLTQTTQFASLDVFSLERSADVLLVLIIGGTGYLYGGLIGARSCSS